MKRMSLYTWLNGILNNWKAFEPMDFISRSHGCSIRSQEFLRCHGDYTYSFLQRKRHFL